MFGAWPWLKARRLRKEGTVGSRLRYRAVVALIGVAGALAAAAVPSRATAVPAEKAAHRDRVLSDERTFARWAHVTQIAPIRRHADPASAQVARLHWYTEDGFDEVYLVLREHTDRAGHVWIQVRVPMRPNGRVGWVRREDLGPLHLTYKRIRVDRSRLRMYLLVHNRRIWSAPVAIGRPGTPTPSGHFWIREVFSISNRGSGYWPYAFGTSDYSTLTDWPGGGVVGIHGPYGASQQIPGRISHGCMRLQTWDDAWLAHHIGVGTPVQVS